MAYIGGGVFIAFFILDILHYGMGYFGWLSDPGLGVCFFSPFVSCMYTLVVPMIIKANYVCDAVLPPIAYAVCSNPS